MGYLLEKKVKFQQSKPRGKKPFGHFRPFAAIPRAAHKGEEGDPPPSPNVGKSFGFLQQNSAKIFAFCRFFDSLLYSISKSFGASRRSCTNVKKLLLRGNFSKFLEKNQNLRKKGECFLKFSEKNQILL